MSAIASAENGHKQQHHEPQMNNPIPEEPTDIPQYQITIDTTENASDSYSLTSGASSDDSAGPSTPQNQVDEAFEKLKNTSTAAIAPTALPARRRRASTQLISSNSEDVKRLLQEEGGTQFVGKVCCGGGCCFLSKDGAKAVTVVDPVPQPENDAFKSLKLNVDQLSLQTDLTNVVELPREIVTIASMSKDATEHKSTVEHHPPGFVKPHAPYDVYSAKLHHARELTKPGAEKRTFHFDIDVTDYPEEGGDVDFVVGGAIGVCAPNSPDIVDEVFDLLGVPKSIRDKPILCRTSDGRWPTIWGDDMARELVTTRRELLTWCSDLQSYPPTKPLLRLLAEYADAPNEKKILLWLSSAQGQGAFCDLRTGPFITIPQLLHAFPSAKPPLNYLLSTLNQLMPRFYSLSHDPLVEPTQGEEKPRRLIEVAVTVHEAPEWKGGVRTGVGSGFLERVAKQLIAAEEQGADVSTLDIRVPMFRGLMANPLAKEFVSDGPMLLVGAGVGIAPFRGFVQRRLKSANCANKVWVLQGVRDSLVDELYRGEWGVEEEKVKSVIESRRGKGKYVQEEVIHQADLVWFIINAIDGRIFVCGSSKGMGEGVEEALIEVAMEKGKLNREEAVEFWARKKSEGQYIAETW